MRKPTPKEKHVMKNCVEGLSLDVALLCVDELTVSQYDVLGTLKVNLSVLRTIHNRLRDES